MCAYRVCVKSANQKKKKRKNHHSVQKEKKKKKKNTSVTSFSELFHREGNLKEPGSRSFEHSFPTTFTSPLPLHPETMLCRTRVIRQNIASIIAGLLYLQWPHKKYLDILLQCRFPGSKS